MQLPPQYRMQCGYESAMNCWTSAIRQGKNVFIDFHEDLYLVREQIVKCNFSDTTSVNRFVVSENILKQYYS